jgi:hypothetical protein
MPRFNFDLVGPRPVPDRQGMVFEDCRLAVRFANELAADLSAVRPELRGKAAVIMTDEHRTITYCVAVPSAVCSIDGIGPGQELECGCQSKAASMPSGRPAEGGI